jgi:hypothetical protein
MPRLMPALAITIAAALASAPALAARGTIAAGGRSGHASYRITERKDPGSGGRELRRTLALKACDDRRDGAGIAAFVIGHGQAEARHGAGTCGAVHHFSSTGRFTVKVCRQDASGHGAFNQCRTRRI